MCKLWRYAEKSCGNCNDSLEPITTLKEEFAFDEIEQVNYRQVFHILLHFYLLAPYQQVQLVYIYIHTHTQGLFKTSSQIQGLFNAVRTNTVTKFSYALPIYPAVFLPQFFCVQSCRFFKLVSWRAVHDPFIHIS